MQIVDKNVIKDDFVTFVMNEFVSVFENAHKKETNFRLFLLAIRVKQTTYYHY